MSIESRRRLLEGKKKPAGIYAYIQADRAGWWITFIEVRPNGTASKTGHAEAFRKYDTLASVMANLKKAPYYADFIKRTKPPENVY